MKWYKYLLLLIPVLIYLFLRLGFRETIEFGYDQPRLATRIIEFNKDGNFLDTQKFAEKSPWGNISWGPSLFLFFSPFFLISQNPVTVSLLISIFNLLSIVLVIYLGYRFFSFTTGLVAGIFLATMPWWWIFSRMIYQPTPVPTFVALMMLLTFMVLEKPKSFWIAPLIFCWGFLLELYFHAFSVITVSAVAITTKIRKLNFIYIFSGIILVFLLFLPFFNVNSYGDYVPQKNEENVFIPGRDDPVSRIKNLLPHYFLIISGGDFSWQLGKGYADFLKGNPETEGVFLIISAATILIFLHNIFLAFRSPGQKLLRFVLILWVIAPIPFLTLIHLPSVPPIPRYFLLSLPALSLLWGLSAEDLVKRLSEYSKIVKFLPVGLLLLNPFYWFIFDMKYYRFVTTYSYPDGSLSVYSDIPYSFLKSSIDFVLKDEGDLTGSSVVISNDSGNPKQYALDWATNYVWSNVYKRDKQIEDPLNSKYFLITTSQVSEKKFVEIYRSGPYSVFRVVDL